MEIVELLKNKIKEALASLGQEVNTNDIVIETTKNNAFGDYSSNFAMKFCRNFSCKPIDLANKAIPLLECEQIKKIEIAGPGFVNFFINNDSISSIIKTIVEKGDDFGKGVSTGKKINLEFVSANPTGLLHVGTARCAAIGSSLANILSFAGNEVTKEYYINDAGKQIENLALSIDARYHELFGIHKEIPEDGYMGADVIEIAKQVKEEYGDKFVNNSDIDLFKQIGIDKELGRIKETLKNFGVTFDVFSSEKVIRENNALENELVYLNKYIYEEEGAKVLRTTDFLDDKDRVIVKSNGDYTYFMPDIVYHSNKMSRGFDHLIDILGADHHGYVNRLKSALMMHGYSENVLDVTLIQMVRFIQDGVEIKASKRTGNAITLQELIEDIGKDASRYFFAMRNPNSHMDFDLSLAVEQSSNNPVYYAQYAHARLCSILDSAKDYKIDISGSKLEMPSEIEVLKCLANFPQVVQTAAKERAPFKITNYIHELAERIHSFYNECRVINSDNLDVTSSRLALVKACKIVMNNALKLIGVSAPEHM